MHKKRRRKGRIAFLSLFLVALVMIDTGCWSPPAPAPTVNVCVLPDKGQRTSEGAVRTQHTPPPLYLGLDAYRHLDKLSYLELGDRVEGMSTADTSGSNADNTHVLRILPNGEHVLFDSAGPGIVTFLRMQQEYGGSWNLTVDGRFPTTVHASDLRQTNPTSYSASGFPYPLSLNTQQSQGSSIVAMAIPFQQSIQWASQHANGNFYALYRKLPFGTDLQSWNGREAVNAT